MVSCLSVPMLRRRVVLRLRQRPKQTTSNKTNKTVISWKNRQPGNLMNMEQSPKWKALIYL